MADLFYAVWDTAAEVANGPVKAEGKVSIAGTSTQSSAVVDPTGGNRSRRVRLWAGAACYVTWGVNPTAVNDGTAGRPQEGPYDAIVVTAGGPEPPAPLLEQLAPDGRLVGPFGGREEQQLLRVRRRGESFERHVIGRCRFVELVGAHGWAA